MLAKMEAEMEVEMEMNKNISICQPQNGSTHNGTVHKAKMLAAIKNGLYLCSAFETQMLEIEY